MRGSGLTHLLENNGPLDADQVLSGQRDLLVRLGCDGIRTYWLAVRPGDGSIPEGSAERLVDLLELFARDDGGAGGSIPSEALLSGLREAAPLSLLLAADGTVLSYTQEIGELIATGTMLTLSSSRQPRLATPEATAELQLAIAEVAAAARAGSRSALRALPLASARQTQPSVVVIKVIAGGGPSSAAGVPSPMIWLSLRNPALVEPPSEQILRTALGLSPKEAEAARAALLGQSIEQHASAQSVTRDAVRYHRKNIFQKTGCRNQVEFVLLVSALLGQGLAGASHTKHQASVVRG